MKNNRNALSEKRQDATELIRLLETIPEDRKSEVLGIVRGFALCAENEKVDRDRAVCSGTKE